MYDKEEGIMSNEEKNKYIYKAIIIIYMRSSTWKDKIFADIQKYLPLNFK
jgi:hypothetical protein